MSDLITFLLARLDEDEAAAARDRLCINCGGHTIPLRSLLDVTGYTHDGRMDNGQWEYGWQGVRCPGRLTDAEPVQNPARVLREVEAKRAILAEHQPGARFAWDEDEQACQRCGDIVTVQWPCESIRALAAVYSDHPDYAKALSEYRQKHDPDSPSSKDI